MVFDRRTAFLRHLRLGDREILRGIFGAVRDRHWDTVEPKVRILALECEPESFRVNFEAECRSGDVHFAWHGEISGAESGTVRFIFDGEAKRPFLKNRIGLCVLHPARECAGQSCEVRFVDGTSAPGTFPQWIAPHQPFKNLRAISHEAAPGLRATISFEGDVFEMEDQRNWTDASFKTYSTPLELPFPVALHPGDRVRQCVTLRLEGSLPERRKPGAVPLRVRVNWSAARALPPIGLGLPAAGQMITAAARESLARIRPNHLRVDLRFHAASWTDRLRAATELALALGVQLHLALFLTGRSGSELDEVLAEAVRLGSPVALWMIFREGQKVTPAAIVDLARRKLEHFSAETLIAAGTDAYFAELNRQRPPADSTALPCFSINPQVHAFDNLSMIETLGAQESIVSSAQQFCAKPVVISPVTLRPRFNPNATSGETPIDPPDDPRQSTGFCAAWTLGTLARLATCAGVHSLTFYETAGSRGVMDDAGHAYPVAHLFAALNGWNLAGECISTEPLRVDALALTRNAGDRRLLLAGLSAIPCRVIVEGVGDSIVRARELSAAGFDLQHQLTPQNGSLEVVLPPENLMLLDFSPAIS
jgi:hypothetical protein